jgi:hypothetical protein
VAQFQKVQIFPADDYTRVAKELFGLNAVIDVSTTASTDFVRPSNIMGSDVSNVGHSRATSLKVNDSPVSFSLIWTDSF